MPVPCIALFGFLLLLLPLSQALADEVAETIQVCKDAAESAGSSDRAYGFGVLPKIGKAGLVIGRADGKGRVHRAGQLEHRLYCDYLRLVHCCTDLPKID
jgi:hypothetical protein